MDDLVHLLLCYGLFYDHPQLGWLLLFSVLPDVIGLFVPVLIYRRDVKRLGSRKAVTGWVLKNHSWVKRWYDIFHSLVFWGCLMMVGVWWPAVVAPCLSAMLHILIDIPVHEPPYFQPRFLFPIADVTVKGKTWSNPFVLVATYSGLGVFYFLQFCL